MNPITEINLEQSTYGAFALWLAAYFDGGTHPVGQTTGIGFPKAGLGFAQSVLPQPLNPVPAQPVATPAATAIGITMTFAADTGQAVQRRWHLVGGVRQQMFYKPVRWNFWVRCETADDQARAACLNGAQLLEAILANAACTHPLAQCGIHRVRPGSSQPVADTTYILRLVPCRAVLKYAVLSQGAALASVLNAPAGTQPTARLSNGIFEVWDAGRQAFVPLGLNNGAVTIGAADTSGLLNTQPQLAPSANARFNNGIFEVWDAGQQAYVPLVANNGAVGTGAPDPT